MRTYTVVGLLAAAAVALTGCTPLAGTRPAPSGDVVVSAGTSNHSGAVSYHVTCGTAGTVAEYRVTTSKDVSYGATMGDSCPAGPRGPLPRVKHPEIHEALTSPLPYHGGDPDSPCGSWGAATRQDAEVMRAAHQWCQARQEGTETR